jgi:hypothetical protein
MQVTEYNSKSNSCQHITTKYRIGRIRESSSHILSIKLHSNVANEETVEIYRMWLEQTAEH